MKPLVGIRHILFFAKRLYYCSILLFHSRPLSAWMCIATFSSDFIPAQWYSITLAMVYCFCCCCFCLFFTHIWVWLLNRITDYIKITLLSDHIIAIYHYVLCDLYWLDCAASKYLVIFYHNNLAVSLSPWFLFLCLILWDECDHFFVIIDYNKSTLLSDHIIAIYHYFIKYPYCLDCAAPYSLVILFQIDFFHIIVIIVYFCLLLSWFIYYMLMSETTRLDHWFCLRYFMSDCIIAIYHYFIQDPYRLDCLVSYSLRIYSNTMTPYQQRYFFVFLWLFTLNGCEYSLVSLIISGVRFWAIILLLHINIYYVTLILSIFWRHIL